MAGVAGMALVCTLPLQESQPSKKALSLPLLETAELGGRQLIGRADQIRGFYAQLSDEHCGGEAS
jgi:hypothetical protein